MSCSSMTGLSSPRFRRRDELVDVDAAVVAVDRDPHLVLEVEHLLVGGREGLLEPVEHDVLVDALLALELAQRLHQFGAHRVLPLPSSLKSMSALEAGLRRCRRTACGTSPSVDVERRRVVVGRGDRAGERACGRRRRAYVRDLGRAARRSARSRRACAAAGRCPGEDTSSVYGPPARRARRATSAIHAFASATVVERRCRPRGRGRRARPAACCAAGQLDGHQLEPVALRPAPRACSMTFSQPSSPSADLLPEQKKRGSSPLLAGHHVFPSEGFYHSGTERSKRAARRRRGRSPR